MDYEDNDSQREGDTPRESRHLASKFTIGVMSAAAVVLLLIGADIALVGGTQQAQARPVVQVVKMSGTPAVLPVVYLTVSPGVKPGPDGKLHDAFTVTDFTVHPGQPLKLVINNTDSGPHSITAPGAGVNITVRPGMHTYTLIVRGKGRFEWYCGEPCDPYSMSHVGYMRGYIDSI